MKNFEFVSEKRKDGSFPQDFTIYFDCLLDFFFIFMSHNHLLFFSFFYPTHWSVGLIFALSIYVSLSVFVCLPPPPAL